MSQANRCPDTVTQQSTEKFKNEERKKFSEDNSRLTSKCLESGCNQWT